MIQNVFSDMIMKCCELVVGNLTRGLFFYANRLELDVRTNIAR